MAATYSPTALDLGLGEGDMLHRQQQETDEQRKKKLARMAQPGGLTYGAGMSPAVTDLMGSFRV